MRWGSVLPLVVVALLIGLLAIGLTLDPREVPSPLIDKPAPDFLLPSLSTPDRQISVADLKGKVSLVNVWASWCVACRDEHPLLVELAGRGLVPIFGLNYKDERADALAWLSRYGDPYTDSIFDAQGAAGLDWGVYGVPETFVLDKQGRIRYKHIGALDADDIQHTLLPIIQGLMAEAG